VMPKLIKKNGVHHGAVMLRKSAHDVWLAGLGALSLAEEEGGKLFKALVRGRGSRRITSRRPRRSSDR